jgi:hypothetical protein
LENQSCSPPHSTTEVFRAVLALSSLANMTSKYPLVSKVVVSSDARRWSLRHSCNDYIVILSRVTLPITVRHTFLIALLTFPLSSLAKSPLPTPNCNLLAMGLGDLLLAESWFQSLCLEARSTFVGMCARQVLSASSSDLALSLVLLTWW